MCRSAVAPLRASCLDLFYPYMEKTARDLVIFSYNPVFCSFSCLERFIRIPADEVNRIVRDSPGHVVDVLVSVMESLCFKIDASTEERRQCVRKVREREMGYLFENMEKISIQEMRRKAPDCCMHGFR